MRRTGEPLSHADFSRRELINPRTPRDGDSSGLPKREADSSHGIWRSWRQPRNELYFIGLT